MYTPPYRNWKQIICAIVFSTLQQTMLKTTYNYIYFFSISNWILMTFFLAFCLSFFKNVYFAPGFINLFLGPSRKMFPLQLWLHFLSIFINFRLRAIISCIYFFYWVSPLYLPSFPVWGVNLLLFIVCFFFVIHFCSSSSSYFNLRPFFTPIQLNSCWFGILFCIWYTIFSMACIHSFIHPFVHSFIHFFLHYQPI